MLREFSKHMCHPMYWFPYRTTVFQAFFQMFNLLIRFSVRIYYCITAVLLQKSNLKSAIDILAYLDRILRKYSLQQNGRIIATNCSCLKQANFFPPVGKNLFKVRKITLKEESNDFEYVLAHGGFYGKSALLRTKSYSGQNTYKK